MPLFHVQAFDKPNALGLRMKTRPAHLEHAKGLGAKLRAGGSMLSDDGETMIGSVLIIEADDRAALDAILDADPYVKADLFARVDIRPFRWALP